MVACGSFSGWTECMVGMVRGSGQPRRMPLVTRIHVLQASFKRAGVRTNGILECKLLSKNAHRTSLQRYAQICTYGLGLGLGLQCQQLVETNHPRGVMEMLACCGKQHACSSIIPRAKTASTEKAMPTYGCSLAMDVIAAGHGPSAAGRP